ncbi:hypothetical protein ACFWY5_55960 [Nonomuraea sp. NPDC059007]|uniref:hypothetical protein n=1 Tax=Nonomuraea sp. NPDC059007 TaxID=3346692 RepID=UPI00368DB5BD
MGRLEERASQHVHDARHALGEALDRVCSLDDEGSLDDGTLARIAHLYHRMSWWQQVTDLTHGVEDTVDGGTAILTVRQHAREFLISARPSHGGLFAQAMAESRRHAAQGFLAATQRIADALTTPPAPAAPATCPDDTYGGHAGPLPDPWTSPPVF